MASSLNIVIYLLNPLTALSPVHATNYLFSDSPEMNIVSPMGCAMLLMVLDIGNKII